MNLASLFNLRRRALLSIRWFRLSQSKTRGEGDRNDLKSLDLTSCRYVISPQEVLSWQHRFLAMEKVNHGNGSASDKINFRTRSFIGIIDACG